MGRTNVVVDDELVERAKRIYGLRTTREVIDFALRRLVGDISEGSYEGLKRLRGIGWDGDLDAMRRSDPALEGWLARPIPEEDSDRHTA